MFLCLIRNVIYLSLEKPATTGITNRILQDNGAEGVKAHKTASVPRKLRQMGSLCVYCKI